ncbi:MAG: transposase [Nitrospinota bacterium]
MERMTEVVPDSDHQSIQQFISDSRWDERAVIQRVAREAILRYGWVGAEVGYGKRPNLFIRVGKRAKAQPEHSWRKLTG